MRGCYRWGMIMGSVDYSDTVQVKQRLIELCGIGEAITLSSFAGDFLAASEIIHLLNSKWWHDLDTGERLVRNKAEMICLMHSELSEAMEGERKGLMDDHLPHRPMAEVELADAVIRIMDYAAAHGYDVGGAIFEKVVYNLERKDHSPEHRRGDGGKKF